MHEYILAIYDYRSGIDAFFMVLLDPTG